MHTYNDTRTRDNTLALYGARHRSRAYRITRSLVRAAVVTLPLIGGLAYSLYG